MTDPSRSPDERSQREKMLAGDLYIANDPELYQEHLRAQRLLTVFNASPADDETRRTELLRQLLGHLGEGAVVKPSLRCDYGSNISIGARTFINYDCLLLDCNRIDIGEDVQFGPGVHVYTATHPLDAQMRGSGLESAHPVTIGNAVWIGGRAVICPGITIGERTVVGAGSVVVKNLPAGVLAVGNPCRILRKL